MWSDTVCVHRTYVGLICTKRRKKNQKLFQFTFFPLIVLSIALENFVFRFTKIFPCVRNFLYASFTSSRLCSLCFTGKGTHLNNVSSSHWLLSQAYRIHVVLCHQHSIQDPKNLYKVEIWLNGNHKLISCTKSWRTVCSILGTCTFLARGFRSIVDRNRYFFLINRKLGR